MSPEKTSFFVTPPSLSHISMQAEPSRCPMSVKRTATPSAGCTASPYAHGRRSFTSASTSPRSYSGSTAGRPARCALRVLYSASLICMCALSRSIMSASEQVAAVAYTAPEKPFFTSSGSSPEWSMCACVSRAKSTSPGDTGRLWFTNMSCPCSMPQSTIKRTPPHSTRVQLPVTSWAAPRNVIFMWLLSRAGRTCGKAPRFP